MMHSDLLLTIPEVSGRLRVRKSRVYALVRGGLLPCVRLGRQVRISERVLAKWIAEGGRGLKADKTNIDDTTNIKELSDD